MSRSKDKIYASSRASVKERSEMWRRIRAEGYNIISTWIDEPDQVSGYRERWWPRELWMKIEREIRECDKLILYVKGVDDFPLKGALVEVGMAIGMGKPVIVVLHDIVLEEPTLRPVGSWLWHPKVLRDDSLERALEVRPW